METQDTLIIDGWQIEVDSNRIVRAGVEQKLEPRCMELLVYLARSSNQVVSRVEIEEQVWHGRVVSYEALSGAIAKIRKAFGDTNKQHRVIETIPKAGYRLIASVKLLEPVPENIFIADRSTRLSAKHPILLPAATILVLMAFGLAWWLPWTERSEMPLIDHMALSLPDNPSIAVLPFTNMSGDPGQEYFADGMTDDLITDLSKVSGLFVISRNSTFTYKKQSVEIRQVAEELGVRYVMEGSVQREGNQVRINAQLIDASSGGHVWAERYDGYLDDVFAMRDQITRKIVIALSARLADQELVSQNLTETNNPAAYDALLRGRDHYRLFTADNLVKAIPHLENAIELDTDFASAHAVLAAVYWGICNNGWANSAAMTYKECDRKTSQHLREAMKNPTPLAHRIAARQHEYGKRWEEAMIEAERAIALDPNDPNGYQAMSALLVNLGRPAEGLQNIKIAMRLDPHTDYLWRLGYAQFHLERYDEAATTLHRATRRNPDFDWNYLLLAATYGHLNREEEARRAADRFNQIRIAAASTQRPFTLADLEYWSIKNEAGLKRLREGMSKAGVPAG